MSTIVEYLERNQQTFSESPLNEVDSLVFCILSYLDFPAARIKPQERGDQVLLNDVLCLTPPDELMTSQWFRISPDAQAFIKEIRASRRFRDVSLAHYENEFSAALEKQFCAMTFVAGDDFAYVAFQGTDGTLAGWKEDFNLCYMDVIPSQRSAERYLSGVASATTLPLYVGGHSKGGNLAEFAGLMAAESVWERVQAVFDHDGPSFLSDPSPRASTPAWHERKHKTIPSSSVFGLILETSSDFEIVRTDAPVVLSHAPLTWLVEGDRFARERDLDASSVMIENVLRDWLASADRAERERFVDTVYRLFADTHATTWSEFQNDLLRNVKTLVTSGASLDDGTKRFLKSILGRAFTIMRAQAIDTLLPGDSGDSPSADAARAAADLAARGESIEHAVDELVDGLASQKDSHHDTKRKHKGEGGSRAGHDDDPGPQPTYDLMLR